MSRLYTLSLLLGVACATRLGSGEPTAEPGAPVDEPAVELELPSPTLAALAEREASELSASAVAPHEEPVPTVSWTLRRGESLAHFARWADAPVEVVAEASGLTATADQLPVGTVVRIPYAEGLEEQVTARRDAHHLRRAEGWLASRGGAVGVTFHVVATGETAWSIARDQGDLPVWVVETYNPTVDLDRLRPGQELMLPELADAVVEGSDPCGE